MSLEEVASQILVNTKRYKSVEQALDGFRYEFAQQFPNKDYDAWNKTIPTPIAANIISNVSKNGAVSIKFLINDLETITKVL